MREREILLRLKYHDENLTPGGYSRCEPETVEELVQFIEDLVGWPDAPGPEIQLQILEEEK